ncbi:MAG: LptF/LptG family permease [Bacteroidaceae bacterium]|nr:LptF/LptG family permease [Bacteroidaceae bacterium]
MRERSRRKSSAFTWLAEHTPLSRLDRYIIGKFLGTYFFSIALIISIAVVFDFNENIDKFLQHDAPTEEIVFDYYLNFIPFYSNLFSQLFVFIAVIFFTTKLAENSEIIAMLSTGTSFKRLIRPYMIAAAVIALLNYGLGAYVIPRGNVKRVKFENKYKNRGRQDITSNIQLEVDTGVIAYISRYEDGQKMGFEFTLDKFEDKKMVKHLQAMTIQYDTLSYEPYHWVITNYQTRDLQGMREIIQSGGKLDTIIKMQPQDLLISRDMEMTLTTPELKAYIDRQKARGFANIQQFEVEYWKRGATSFATFILTIIGVSISARKRKNGMGIALGIGLALILAYIMFQTVSSTLAINANFPAFVAVWIPNIVFSFIAFYYYKKAPR